MHDFHNKSRKLRIEVINYITDYLKKTNRNIIVPKGCLTYIDWDYSQTSDNEDFSGLVPEIEISAICLSPERGEMYFINSMGEELHQGNLDTEELIYVADFLDELDALKELEDDAPETK